MKINTLPYLNTLVQPLRYGVISACLIACSSAHAALIGQYTFENDRSSPTPNIYNSATSTYDATNNGSTIEVGPSTNYRYFEGKIGTNNSDYIQHNNAVLAGATALSVNLWFNTSVADSNHAFVGGSGLYSFEINEGTNIGRLRVAVKTTGNWVPGIYSDGGGTLNDGAWHMGTVTYDGVSGALKMYVDGVQQTQTSSLAGTVASGATEYIGLYAPPQTNAYVGYLSDVRYYDNAMDATEVMNLYNATMGSYVPEPSTYAALAGLAMMGLAFWRRYRR